MRQAIRHNTSPVEANFAHDYGGRAMAAYYRAGNTDQPTGTVMRYTVSGKDYVVLDNTHGILAVYRIKSDGKLKVLRRWPAVLNEIVEITS